MNEKGFTLVEIIAVIAILALLMIITTPAYNTVSDKIKERNFTSKKSVIEKQTIEFVNEYMKDETYKSGISNKICFTARFLIRNGIVTSDDEKDEVIINDITKEEYRDNDRVIAVWYDIGSRKLNAATITDKINSVEYNDAWFNSGTNCKIIYD